MVRDEINEQIAEREDWALRRQKGIPNNRRLWVLACMDERLPVEEALGIGPGDAHIFRNAGGLVTDDAIRSAMLSTQFFDTREIIVVMHTECGMMSETGDALVAALKAKGIDPDSVCIDPACKHIKLEKGGFGDWIRTFRDVDEACLEQVRLLEESPLIPDHVEITGYIWEVETDELRQPRQRLSEKVNTSEQMRGGA